MQIVEPYAHLLIAPENGVLALRVIESAGRISHRSEDAQTEDSWRRFIKAFVLEHGDWSIVEHATAAVDMLVDRGITHEVVRHRLFSYTQESTRFVNYDKKMPPSFIMPPIPAYPVYLAEDWRACVTTCIATYTALVQAGAAPQLARSVLPNALASRIVMTGNLRAWRHFLVMRTTKESHPQMRQVTVPLLAEFQATFPLLYDDIEPGMRQVDAMRLPR